MNFDQMLKTKSKEELWQRYCSFLDMSLDEFMEVQNQLLMEQIELYANCELGQKIMKGQKPRNPDEFRRYFTASLGLPFWFIISLGSTL